MIHQYKDYFSKRDIRRLIKYVKNISKKITIVDLLKKYDLLDEQTQNLIWHMSVGKLTIDEIKKIYVFSEGLTEEQIAKEVFFLIRKCDLNSPEHDNDLYVSGV